MAPPLSATDPITKLLEAIPSSEQLHFLAFVEGVYQSRYTGSYTVHCKNGVPRQVDLGSPVRLSIVQPLDSEEADPAGS